MCGFNRELPRKEHRELRFRAQRPGLYRRPRNYADAAQVFVANPNKPPEIARILRRNKDRLLVFLKDFHNDKDGRSFP